MIMASLTVHSANIKSILQLEAVLYCSWYIYVVTK